MPIVQRYDATGIPSNPENPKLKYGMAMVGQQQKADQEMRLRAQDAQYDMERIGAMQQYKMPQQSSRGQTRELIDNAISMGAIAEGDIRAARNLQQQEIRVMRDKNLDSRQRADALANIDSELSIIMSNAAPRTMAAARSQTFAPPVAAKPKTAQQAFRSDPKLEDRFMAMVDEMPDSENLSYQDKLKMAMQLYNDRESALADPAPVESEMSAPQVNQAPPTRGRPAYISVAPGGQVAQSPSGVAPQQSASSGWTPKSTSVYSQDGKFLGDTSLYDEAGANYIRQQAAPQPQAGLQAPSGRAGFDAAMGSNMDTVYDLANMDRSPGTNFFDRENPAYAAMRAPDQSILNPPKEVGKFKGRYGLGGVDLGINPATGNRVTLSVRPGGTMLEYDEPGLNLNERGKGSVNYIGRRKQQTMVSPGEQWSNANPYPEGTPTANPSAPVVNQQPAIPQGPAPEILPPETVDVDRNVPATPAEPQPRTTQPKYGEQKPPLASQGPTGWRGMVRDFVTGNEPGWTKPIPQGGKKGAPSEPAVVPPKIIEFAATQPEEVRTLIDELFNPRTPAYRQEIISAELLERGVDLRGLQDQPAAATSQNQSPSSQSRSPQSKYRSQMSRDVEEAVNAEGESQADGNSSAQNGIRTWKNVDGAPIFNGKLVRISEPIASNGTQTRTVTLMDSNGDEVRFDINSFSPEDQNFLMTQWNIEIAKQPWSEKDWLGRYGTGKAEQSEKVKLSKNQSMNPRTNGYETERREPNPEWWQKNERTPSARRPQGKRTG